jgi:hypothetical protein
MTKRPLENTDDYYVNNNTSTITGSNNLKKQVILLSSTCFHNRTSFNSQFPIKSKRKLQVTYNCQYLNNYSSKLEFRLISTSVYDETINSDGIMPSDELDFLNILNGSYNGEERHEPFEWGVIQSDTNDNLKPLYIQAKSICASCGDITFSNYISNTEKMETTKNLLLLNFDENNIGNSEPHLLELNLCLIFCFIPSDIIQIIQKYLLSCNMDFLKMKASEISYSCNSQELKDKWKSYKFFQMMLAKNRKDSYQTTYTHLLLLKKRQLIEKKYKVWEPLSIYSFLEPINWTTWRLSPNNSKSVNLMLSKIFYIPYISMNSKIIEHDKIHHLKNLDPDCTHVVNPILIMTPTSLYLEYHVTTQIKAKYEILNWEKKIKRDKNPMVEMVKPLNIEIYGIISLKPTD